MTSRSGARSIISSVLSIALLVAIAAFAVLVALQLRTERPPRFDVASPEGVECPVGEGTPACFSFAVLNVGDEPSLVRCIVTVESGEAAFLNDMPTYTSSAPFEPGIAEQLTVKVDQGDASTVTEPTMICQAD
jgi:hypothetical protein